MRYLSVIVFLFVSSLVSGQNVLRQDLVTMEDTLKNQLKRLRAAETDEDRFAANELLKSTLKKVIVVKEAFTYPFDSLTTMGTLTSPDNEFRLFNWNIENEDGTHQYHCFVVREERGDLNSYVELEDKSSQMVSQPKSQGLSHDNWYGALYYKIIPTKKGGKKLYTLLAIDPNNRMSCKKVIEVMYFAGKRIKFGYPIIRDKNGTYKRYFLEYQAGQYVGLKHHTQKVKKEEVEYIVFDHLSPKAEQLEGMYEYYVTDGSYDAFELDSRGYWVLKEDVDQRNPSQKGKFNDPLKNNYDHEEKNFFDNK